MNKNYAFVLSVVFLFFSTLAFGNVNFSSFDGWPNTIKQERAAVLSYVANPYVVLPPSENWQPTGSSASDINKVRLLDLRGLECYPQPDRLTVCGEGDTLSLLFYTKSEAPIFDVIVELNFGEGIVFDGYAEIGSPDGMMMTILDTVNTENPESPVFRLDQLSRPGGAVVMQVGIRALCGVDFVLNPPSISVNLSYPGCAEDVELEPISTEPLTPEVRFTAGPDEIIIADFGVDYCMQQSITQATFDAGAGEATLVVADYGYPEVSLTQIRVDGVSVPVTDITVDPTSGSATVLLDGNANTGYFNGDGILGANEVSVLDLCFGITACPPADTPDPITPTLAINATCMGISCGGNQDFETENTIRVLVNFNNGRTVNFFPIQDPSACGGPDGGAQQYIFDVSIRANRTELVQGQLDNLRFFLTDCDGGVFTMDSVGFFEGGVPTGALTTIPTVSPIAYILSNGSILVNIRNLVDDYDGPGGLADLDGDGFVDDLPGGETFRARVFLSPISCALPGGCGSAPEGEGNSCRLNLLRFQGSVNCGRNAFNASINPNGDPFNTNSTGDFGNADTTTTYTGFNFGTFGNIGNAGNPTSQTETVEFDVVLADGDFNACPAPGGDIQLQLTYIGDPATVRNLDLSNITFDEDTTLGTPPPIPVSASDVTVSYPDTSTAVFTIDVGSTTTGVPMRYSVDMTFDTAVCIPVANNPLIISLVEYCDACECSPFIRACGSVVARVDPDDSDCICDYVSMVEADRMNFGFTDRDQTTQLTAVDFPGPDNQQLDLVLPGDVINITAEVEVTNALNWNRLTERISFSLLGRQDNSGITPNLLGRLDINAARVQSFVIQRGATIFDVANMPVTGSTVGQYSGVLVNGVGTADRYPNAVHTGLPLGGYNHTHQNATNDYQDNNRVQVFFFGEDRVLPGEFNSLQGLYDLIGGEFEDGDVIRWNIQVPVTLTPDELRDGTATNGPLSRNDLILRASVDGRSFTAAGTLGANQIAGGGIFEGDNAATACIFQDTLFIHDARLQLESRITYSPDGCTAEIEHDFTILNPLPAGWYPNEYRPIIGLDSLVSEFPAPYIYSGGAYYELSAADESDSQGRVMYEPDSLARVTGDEIAYCPDDEGRGELYFLDAELKNGTRAPNYFDFDLATDDVSLSGGTFPLIGVGGPAVANPDELTFGYPLQRICTNVMPVTPLNSGFTGSYPYLSDYKVIGYQCNQGNWYQGGPLDTSNPQNCNGQTAEERFYWPWLRTSTENPGRVPGSDEYDEINTPVPNVDVTASLTTDMLQNLGGGEPNTLTICPDPDGATIPGGTVVLEVPTNVTLDGVTETVSGNPVPFPIAKTTDSSTVYTVTIPTGLAAEECYDLNLETTLLFCGPNPICASIVPCPVDVDIVLAKNLDCVEKVCYAYRAGIPEAAIGFTFPTPVLCATDTYQVNFNNTGNSLLTDVDPVIWLPAGLTPSNFMVEISASGVTTSINPIMAMIDSDSTGVNGIAYVFDDAALNALLGADGLEPLGAITFSFDLTSDCESFSGGRANAQLGTMGDCTPYTVFRRGPQIYLSDPTGDADFSVEPSRTEINCTEGGASLLITSINVGKSGATDTKVCFTLPPGLTVTPDDIQAVSPIDYTPVNFEAMNIGTGGATQLCFDGPVDAPIGSFFCINVDFALAPDVDCGPLAIGYSVMSSTTVECSTDGTMCEIETLNSNQFLDLEVVPSTTVGEATVVAECNADPSLIDLVFSIELESIGAAFSGNINVELFYDLDGNGVVDSYDTSLGVVSSTATIPASGTGMVEGTITASTDQSCAILARLMVPGCACSEIEIPFPVIEPGFVDRLSQNVVICPDSDLTIEGLCGMYELEFVPPAAGNIVVDDGAGTATISLNPGFGIEVPVDLVVTYSLGGCVGQEFVIKVSEVEEFDFGPFEIDACNVGGQRIDLMIPTNLQEDIEVLFTPSTYLDDPTSQEPIITNPVSDITYMVEFSLNGDCVSETTLMVNVEQTPTLTLTGATGCSTGIPLDDYTEVTPAATEVFFFSTGDGTFTPSNRLADDPTYVPGPQDLVDGSVMITARSENPEGPCGLVITRATIEILLVDCGSFFWNGERN